MVYTLYMATNTNPVVPEHKECAMKMSPADIERFLAECQAKFAHVRAVVLDADCGDVLDSGDGALIVNHIAYGKVDVERVLDGTAVAESVTLTADGRGANVAEWHEGAPSDDEWVRYERWSARGREAHGYVDTVSRKLVQTG